MKRAITLGLMGLLIGSAASMQVQAVMSENEKSVEANEQQWVKANNTNDVALEATLLAGNFILITAEGKVQDKTKFLEREKATKYTHAAIEDVLVRMYGSTAIATYVFIAKGTDPDGKPMDVRVRQTDTWVKMPDGKFQCVAAVDTALKQIQR